MVLCPNFHLMTLIIWCYVENFDISCESYSLTLIFVFHFLKIPLRYCHVVRVHSDTKMSYTVVNVTVDAVDKLNSFTSTC